MHYLDEYRAAYDDDSDNHPPDVSPPAELDLESDPASRVCLSCGRPAAESTCIEPTS